MAYAEPPEPDVPEVTTYDQLAGQCARFVERGAPFDMIWDRYLRRFAPSIESWGELAREGMEDLLRVAGEIQESGGDPTSIIGGEDG